MSTPAAPGPETLRVCGLAGSLRAGSYNRALLRVALEVAPSGMRIEIFDLMPVPLYNADLEESGIPESVQALRAAIRAADALLLATPEYNYGVSGVLKNALDWASRPPARSTLIGKPTAILGASAGWAGTSRAQAMLRQVLAGTLTPVMPSSEVFVARAGEKFDAQGRFVDDGIRERIATLLTELARWTRMLQSR